MTVRTLLIGLLYVIGYSLRITLYTGGTLYGLFMGVVALSPDADDVFSMTDVRRALFGEAWMFFTILVGVFVGMGVIMCRPIKTPRTPLPKKSGPIPLLEQ